MKFIAKNSNLRIILKPGLPAQPVLGIPAQGSVSVKFQDGLAEVKDQKIIDKMLTHPGYIVDFIAVDEDGNDPFAAQREEIEPGHVITEIKYGHVERSVGSPKKTKIPAELQAAIAEMANEMANKRMKELLPSLLEDTLKKMAQMSSVKQAVASQEGVIAAVEGDSSLLDNDTKEESTEDFEEAEFEEVDDESETTETTDYDPIPVKKKAGRPSTKK